jgi:hypothetical protein
MIRTTPRPPTDQWRTAFVETRARGFGPDEWLRLRGMVTIRPGDSLQAIQYSTARDMGIPPTDVRLVLWDR